jgi:hypothetical protein
MSWFAYLVQAVISIPLTGFLMRRLLCPELVGIGSPKQRCRPRGLGVLSVATDASVRRGELDAGDPKLPCPPARCRCGCNELQLGSLCVAIFCSSGKVSGDKEPGFVHKTRHCGWMRMGLFAGRCLTTSLVAATQRGPKLSSRYSSRPGLEHVGPRSQLLILAAQPAARNTCSTPDLAHKTGCDLRECHGNDLPLWLYQQP